MKFCVWSTSSPEQLITQKNDTPFEDTLEIIDEHLAEEINVADLCQQVGTCKNVLYKQFNTHLGCASRPGNCYQNILARQMHMDFLNLGFSGCGKAEDAMIDYLAGLPMVAFISDYDHNAPDAEHLKKTHFKLYEAVRKTHPNMPYIMLSRYDFNSHYEENIERRDVIYETYRRARAAGDRNVFYIDGASVFRGQYQEMCAVDGTYPNDLGFALLADAIGAELKIAMTQNLLNE